MEETIRVVDHARALNALLALSRLERMLRVYRTWVNVDGVEGGFALTWRELECVLEFPARKQHVDFLFDTFRCEDFAGGGKAATRPACVDLVSLLTTAAILGQGALADKARFVFSLVDLDTEDDIVEAELALVISTCCRGLARLGLARGDDGGDAAMTSLAETDAVALAYEAFDFVELEDGDKMSFELFLKWCVFHPRPRALLENIRMQEALDAMHDEPTMRPFRHYNTMHFGQRDEHAEGVRVLVGPVVGKVSATQLSLLMEVDTPAVVTCFAFVSPAEHANWTKDQQVPTKELMLEAFQPALFTLSGLAPGTSYVLRFLGIRQSDRDRCVGFVTTSYLTTMTTDDEEGVTPNPPEGRWKIRVLNHRRRNARHVWTSSSPEAQIYRKVASEGYTTRAPLLTVHFGGISFPRQKVVAMLEMLATTSGNEHSLIAAEERVREAIKEGYRSVLAKPELWETLRSHSNWFFGDSETTLFGDFRPRIAVLDTREEERNLHLRTTLVQIALPVWQTYIGCLWGEDEISSSYLELDGETIFAPITNNSATRSEEEERLFTEQVSDALKASSFTAAIVLLTTVPLFSFATDVGGTASGVGDISREHYQNAALADMNPDTTSMEQQWRLLQEIVGWNLADLNRQIVLLSFGDTGGCSTLVSIKDTTLSIKQLVCGPLVGVPPIQESKYDATLAVAADPSDKLIVLHGTVDRRPQFVAVSSLGRARKGDMPPAGRRRSSGVAEAPLDRFQAVPVALQGPREVRRIVGPVVGCVSIRSVRVLIECDAEADIVCVLTDRLCQDEFSVAQRVHAYRPTVFKVAGLAPGRVYDIVFKGLSNDAVGVVQTPHEHLPAFRLVIVSDDSVLEGKVSHYSSSDGEGIEPSLPYGSNVTNHLLSLEGTLQTDVVVHLGCVTSLAHDLSRLYGLLAQDRSGANKLALQNAIRFCIRRHWSIPENQQLLSRGSHWLPGIGVLQMLLAKEDVPVEFLRNVRAVLEEYEQVADLRSDSNAVSEKYVYRLQSGVIVLMIDTLEAILDDAEAMPFAQSHESLLSASQWEALEFWLRVQDLPERKEMCTKDQVGSPTRPNVVVIMCDLPLISQQGKDCELKHLWRRGGQSTDHATPTPSSWGLYPQEQARLIRLVFRKMHEDPTFHVVFTCRGAFAARTTIVENATNLSFQQIVVGPVSRSRTPTWVKVASSRSVGNAPFGDAVLAACFSVECESPIGAASTQQYSTLEVAPHAWGAASNVHFYLQHQNEARLLLGPVIGRVTPRAARILIELDRPVPNLVLILTDSATLQRFLKEAKVEAFTPTILKIEGLSPGTRYSISFEGLMASKETVLGYVLTPAWVALTSEWVVVNHNAMTKFLPKETNVTTPGSQWSRILAKGMPAFTAQRAGKVSHRNGDSLGDHKDVEHTNFNPWHSIEDEHLSEPLINPQLLLHLGGQVDMSRAFTDDELAGLVLRIAEDSKLDFDDDKHPEAKALRAELRHRMQEVYRVTWGVPPMKRLLGYCSNLMFLNESTDLHFSATKLRDILDKSQRRGSKSISDSALAQVELALRGIAFELWQLYQNQLWVDLYDRELEYGGKSSENKVAYSSTYGICRMLFANVSHEVHQYCNAVEAEKHAPQAKAREPSKTSSSVSQSSVSLFSTASWKVIDEVLELSSGTPDTGSGRPTHSSSSTRVKNPVQQLVVVIPGDLMAWGGSANQFPGLRAEIVRVLEKLFAWKFVDRIRREVSVICCRTRGSSISYEVTDNKLNEKLALTCIGSVSEARELLHRDPKKVKEALSASQMMSATSISKGHFSKRFTYLSATATTFSGGPKPAALSTNGLETTTSSEGADHVAPEPVRCRTYASYRFITDFRRGFFDETLRFFPPRVTLPKAVLGPVIGRMVVTEAPASTPEEPEHALQEEAATDDSAGAHVSVPILLEINADARIVCVVTDILANQDVRVTQTMTRYEPQVFLIASLVPERRYVYRFEGIANSELRRGSFHTPPSPPSTFTFLSVSSNIPEQMEEARDSLWGAMATRALAPWCGLDAILHLGGQVPMHEAAFECFEWVQRQRKLHAGPKATQQHCKKEEGSTIAPENASKEDSLNASLRRKVRQRMQQRYRLCWNIPGVRETLANVSNWFVRSQADIAPFFRNHEVLHTQAARLVLDEAMKVVADYQLVLMQREETSAVTDATPETPESPLQKEVGKHNNEDDGDNNRSKEDTAQAPAIKTSTQGEQDLKALTVLTLPSPSPPSDRLGIASTHNNSQRGGQDVGDNRSDDVRPTSSDQEHTINGKERTDTAQFVQVGEMGVFVCDMRATPRNDVVTCNNRLLTPLTRQERAIVGEQQWLQLEKALRKKALLAFVLCLELPLILTDADQVDEMRVTASERGDEASQEEAAGRWQLYNRQWLFQHWVSCRRQLEQLLHLLFRWKAKRRGRDVLVLSGGMRVGMETLLQDHESRLALRNLTVGPLTAHVDATFDNLPLEGTACPTFLGSGREQRFTFSHSLVAEKNYLLTRIAVTREQVNVSARDKDDDVSVTELLSVAIQTEFIADDGDVDGAHPVHKYRRFPSWWAIYVPMGKAVFWDDTVVLRAQSDEDIQKLWRYLYEEHSFVAALEVFYDKYEFAEAARMEELRSTHRRRARGPRELRASLRAVFAEIWRVLPEVQRQHVAYFLDAFVFDFLLSHLAPKLFEAEEDGEEPKPVELAAFSTLCQDFVFHACLLHLSLRSQQEDERRERERQRAEARRQAQEREAERVQEEQARAEEEAELAKLQHADPEAFAKLQLAKQEQALQEKQARVQEQRELRKAERMRDVEEELAIAKEQRKLDKMAERGGDPREFARRRELLAARVRKLDERKRQREAEKTRRAGKKSRKKDKTPQAQDARSTRPKTPKTPEDKTRGSMAEKSGRPPQE